MNGDMQGYEGVELSGDKIARLEAELAESNRLRAKLEADLDEVDTRLATERKRREDSEVINVELLRQAKEMLDKETKRREEAEHARKVAYAKYDALRATVAEVAGEMLVEADGCNSDAGRWAARLTADTEEGK